MTISRVSFKALLFMGLAPLVCGCNYLVPFAVLANPKQKIAPEYDKLHGKRTVVMIWADPATLFDYPYVQVELATYVSDKLSAELKDTDIVDPVRVADFRERSLHGSLDPERVGREFEADTVIYIELLQFQIRDPDAPDFVRAQIEASVSVYDLKADPDEPRIFRLESVEVRYPERGGLLFTTTNAIQVRQTAYAWFAEP